MFLLKNATSAFDEWLRMGGLEPESNEEECIRAHSGPHISKYRAEAKKNTLEIDALLEMLEVRLIEIMPEV